MPTSPMQTGSTSGDTTLEQWHVLQTHRGTRHFAGWCPSTHQTLVSSPITSYNPAARIGMTALGLRFSLVGHPGGDGIAKFIWAFAAFDKSILQTTDVSGEYAVPVDDA